VSPSGTDHREPELTPPVGGRRKRFNTAAVAAAVADNLRVHSVGCAADVESGSVATSAPDAKVSVH
jgi:hypothetical protein